MDNKLLAALNGVLEAAGGRRAVEKRMGRSKGYLRDIFRRGAIRYQTIRDILKAAGVGPGDFFYKLHPPESAQKLDVAGVATGEDPDPDLTGLLRLIGAQANAAKLVSGTQINPANEAATLKAFEAAAAKLDEERYSDPCAAAEAARRILFDQVQELQVHPICKAAIAAKIAGVLGSCYRIAAKLREAGWALREAWEQILRYGSRADQAWLLRRIGAYANARGHYSRSVDIAGEAAKLYWALRNYAGIGGCSVDQGVSLVYDGRFDEAIEAFEMGLRFLPERDLINRASALSSLAYVYHQRGDLLAASQHLEAAKECGLQEPYGAALLIRIRGDIAHSSGELVTAVRYYLEARDLLLKINPVDAALAGIDAATSLFDLGLVTQGVETARELGRLLEPLRSVDRVAEERLLELLLTIQRGEEISRRNFEHCRREILAAATLQDR